VLYGQRAKSNDDFWARVSPSSKKNRFVSTIANALQGVYEAMEAVSDPTLLHSELKKLTVVTPDHARHKPWLLPAR
jgi:hypothetical protein